MADKPKTRQEVIRQYKRELLKPLESVGGTIGELQGKLRQYIADDIAVSAGVVGYIQSKIDTEVWQVLSDISGPVDALLEKLNRYLVSSVDAVGESIATASWHDTVLKLPDGSGWLPGSDTRSAAEKAADPLTPGSCNAFLIPADSYPPPTTQPPPVATTPPKPVIDLPPDTAANYPTQPAPLPLPAIGGICDVEGYGEAVTRALAAESASQPPPRQSLSDWFSRAVGLGPDVAAQSPDTAAQIALVRSALDSLVDPNSPLVKSLRAGAGCGSSVYSGAVWIREAIAWAERLTGWAPPQLKLPQEYTINAACPVEFPTADEAIRCYLGDTINASVLQSWLAQQNKCWEPQQRLIDAVRSKLNPTELLLLRRRGIIYPHEYVKRMRQLGYTNEAEIDLAYKLAEEVPPMSELIRYMVRDTADDTRPGNPVQTFGMDANFTDKFQGQVRKWAEQQGITEDFARHSWRAHWSIPAPGQLFSMYHRLRNLPQFGGKDKVLQDVQTALEQQDILPYWIPRLMAISFRPLTRVDVRRAFDIGALDEKAVTVAYLDNGYSDENADALTRFTVVSRERGITNHRAIKLYKAGTIARDDSEKMLADDRFRKSAIDSALAIADRQQSGHSAVKRFRQRFITRQQAETMLLAHGIPKGIFDLWLDEAAATYINSPPVKLYGRGVIDRAEAEARLTRAGITRDMFTQWLDDSAPKRTNHWAIQGFRKGAVDRAAANAAMLADGWRQEQIDPFLDRVEAELQAGANFACAEALVDRFLRGEFDANKLLLLILGFNVPVPHAEAMVKAAKCKREAIGKDPPTATLCQWLELGLIQPIAFVDRLVNLGWTRDDATNILSSCLSKIGAARAKEAEKIAKQDAAAAAKAAQRQQRIQNQLDKDVARRERMATEARKARERRKGLLLKAADALRNLLPIDLPIAAGIVEANKNRVQQDAALSVDDAIAAVIKAVEGGTFDTIQGFADAVDSAAAAIIELQDAVESSNGLPPLTS